MASTRGIPGGFFGKFFTRTISDAAGYGIGGAIQSPLEPLLIELKQVNWENAVTAGASIAPDVLTLAAGVAQGQVSDADARAWAHKNGFGEAEFTALVNIANIGPGVTAAYELWRRDVIKDAGFKKAIGRLGIETEWIDDLVKIKDVLLDPSVIANAVQQGHVTDEGILPLPVSGKMPYSIPLTTIALSPTAEAAGHGLTKDRLRIEANLVGLPPGDHEMLDMWNRGIIDEESVDAGLREGHRKTKWTPAVKELRFAVLTAIQAVNLHLRGWIERPEMLTHGAKVGYSPELMDLLFKGQGRPLSWHQIWIGLQRGGTYDGPTAGIDPAFLTGLKQSSIRPEWFNLAWHSRYTYPSAFVLRALTSDGTFSAAQTETALVDMGWRPDWAKQAAAKWAGGTGAVADPHIKKAQTALYNTTRSAYLAGDATDAVALAKLPQAGVTAAAVDDVFALWKLERDVDRQRLTPAQLKKAFAKTVKNPLTDQPWTRDEVLAELLARGWNSQDANTFLDTPSGP